MTDSGDLDALFDGKSLDGHSIDELSDYLDRGRTPADPAIDSSPGCQIALAGLARLRAMSETLVETDAAAEPARDDSWVSGILDNIELEAHAGRDIPIQHSAPAARLVITEGAVRGLIRAAGDSVGGILIGRCRLDGDVTVPGEAIGVRIDASVFFGERIPEIVARVREAIYTELLRHTELNFTSIDVTIHDVHHVRSSPEEVAE
ncbi:Asp23/Gls24 family envelope stress response protein [Marisediminicola senii]|uniref:Asp23/Gls24 family envelope stress response protein n=1 Tax=Marisediminicola senii TaxID=2711233 RepID=UPI0013ECA993|nr:Asp23/Gls24 family envelope stress response protein [Marisediminicola senii]